MRITSPSCFISWISTLFAAGLLGGLSLGIAKTADFMFAMMQPEELEADNIVLCKIIKNRYAKRSGVKKFRLILDNDMQQIREADVIPPGAAVGGKNNTAEVDDWIM